ncbi:Fe-S cluster assembly ATPase SufC [Candidatus Babeliales bacterium]|nr:Fe-S cluster assembly ATPase SufC [Candidatus Babeliales bacterium]
MPLLQIKNVHVSVEENEILKGVSLEVFPGEIHAIMGPNGSGKSTLTYTLMGHPRYTLTAGEMLFDGTSITDLTVDARARMGIFLAFQYPYEVEGVPLKDFLRQAYNTWYAGTEKQIGLKAFKKLLEEKMSLLGVSSEFVERPVNVGCSGGEKKRIEMLQMAILQPRLVILDEIDSGLDIDALRVVCDALKVILKQNSETAVVLITHYKRILEHVTPDYVHIMQQGKIVRSGDKSLVDEIESKGYGL